MGRRSAIVKLAELPELSLLQDLVAHPHWLRCMRGDDEMAKRTRPRHTWDFALRSAAPTPAMRAQTTAGSCAANRAITLMRRSSVAQEYPGD